MPDPTSQTSIQSVRGVMAVLTFVLAACFPAGEDTTTNSALAEPSTTASTTSTTVPSTTTTTEATTTTREEECTERDGVLRNGRGFVCPGHLVVDSPDRIGTRADRYLPGKYETTIFTPAFRFTREEPFYSTGETSTVVHLDLGPVAAERTAYPRAAMYAWGPSKGPLLRRLVQDAWVHGEPIDIRTSDFTFAGVHATRIEFITRCAERLSSHDCQIGIEDLETRNPSAPSDGYWDQQRVTLLLTEPHSEAAFGIIADEPLADDYWIEVAMAILDSIEFLDP